MLCGRLNHVVVGEVGGPVIGVAQGGIESVVQLFHHEHQPVVSSR
jgi:hypothetical protein